MMEKTNSLITLTWMMEFNDVNGESVVAINQKLPHFLFLENC